MSDECNSRLSANEDEEELSCSDTESASEGEDTRGQNSARVRGESTEDKKVGWYVNEN